MVLQLFGSPSLPAPSESPSSFARKRSLSSSIPLILLARAEIARVPYIVDDGFVLYESRAICRYIAAKYAHQGTPLLPSSSDLKTIALFEQAASIEQNSFEPYASKCGMEKILGKQKYLAGDELTIVDLFHISWGVLLKAGGSDIMESKPNLARQVWWIEITSRPAWVAVKDGVQSVEKY
ncbi:hypothetical protein BDZ89DRAFT_1124099 [Hymenopellis radicata]|nr:hypothetical protein BDZ89DRAFT_1124099 [Hymenopellis radicata]